MRDFPTAWKHVLRSVPLARRSYIRSVVIARAMTKPMLDALLRFHGVRYNMWDVITTKSCDFLDDPDFRRGYAAAQRQENLPRFDAWRAYINQWAAFRGLQLDGDFVECGVDRGRLAMSNVVATNFQQHHHRRYYLFDTFSGLDPSVSAPEEVAFYRNHYTDVYAMVRASFAPFPNVVLVRGSIPKILPSVPIARVAFLHIDMNSVAPEMAALAHFWPKVVPGGIVLLDDYNAPAHIQQKRAFDAFARAEATRILALPTGQGLLVKL